MSDFDCCKQGEHLPKPSSFAKGDRVRFHPASDNFMRGHRFGTVTRVGSVLVSVQSDRTRKRVREFSFNLIPVEASDG